MMLRLRGSHSLFDGDRQVAEDSRAQMDVVVESCAS